MDRHMADSALALAPLPDPTDVPRDTAIARMLVVDEPLNGEIVGVRRYSGTGPDMTGAAEGWLNDARELGMILVVGPDSQRYRVHPLNDGDERAAARDAHWTKLNDHPRLLWAVVHAVERGFAPDETGDKAPNGPDPATDPALSDLWRRRCEAHALERASGARLDAITNATVLPNLPSAVLLREDDRALKLAVYADCKVDGRLIYPFESADAERRGWRRAHWRWLDRAVTPEDNLPADAYTVSFREVWPEAQARADEIAVAWDEHQATVAAIRDESGLDAANAEWEALDDDLAAIDCAIEVEPARTFAGLSIKARLAQMDIEQEQDPSTRLITGLIRDILAMEKAGCIQSHDATSVGDLSSIEGAAALNFEAYTFDAPLRDPQGWSEALSHYAIGLHVADKTLRMTKPEMVAFIVDAGAKGDQMPRILLEALDVAQTTLEGWGKLLEVARARYLVAGSATVLADAAKAEA